MRKQPKSHFKILMKSIPWFLPIFNQSSRPAKEVKNTMQNEKTGYQVKV